MMTVSQEVAEYLIPPFLRAPALDPDPGWECMNINDLWPPAFAGVTASVALYESINDGLPKIGRNRHPSASRIGRPGQGLWSINFCHPWNPALDRGTRPEFRRNDEISHAGNFYEAIDNNLLDWAQAIGDHGFSIHV